MVGVVRDLSATPEPGPALQSIVVDWRPPAGRDLMDHYLVYGSRQRRFDPDDATLLTEAPVSRFVHAGLGPDAQTWHYRVVPIDAAGDRGRFRAAPQTSARTEASFVVGATASSQYSTDYAPRFAVDGAMTSRWAAAKGSDDEWIQIELAESVTAGTAEIHWQGAHAVDYDLLVSPDGTDWTAVHEIRDKPDESVDELELSGAGAFGFVRMHGLRRATEWGFSIWEFWVRP